MAGTSYNISVGDELGMSNAWGQSWGTAWGDSWGGVVPPPPVAAFSGAPLSGEVPLAVAFTDLSTGSPTSWLWDFGDGGTSTEQSPTHTYAVAGTYTVALTATNAGGSDTDTKPSYVTVTSVPVPPAPTTPAPSGLNELSGEAGGYTVPPQMVGMKTLYPSGGAAHVPDLAGEDYRVRELRVKKRRAVALLLARVMMED